MPTRSSGRHIFVKNNPGNVSYLHTARVVFIVYGLTGQMPV